MKQLYTSTTLSACNYKIGLIWPKNIDVEEGKTKQTDSTFVCFVTVSADLPRPGKPGG